MNGPLSLYEAARELLVACEEAVALTPSGAIARAYVSPGPPAFDAIEQLTVHVGGPVIADTAPLQPPLQPFHRVAGTGMVNMVALVVTVLRAVPVPTQYEGELPVWPEPYWLDAAAQATISDLWVIWNHVATLKRNGTLFGGRCREMTWDPAVSVNTEGGCAGWMLTLRVQLDGYPTVSS